MEPRKYRGYAQSTGFDPISVPDTVSRIAREGERTLRGMRDVQQQLRENQSNYISGLERKQNLERQNRDEIFNFNERQRKRVFDDEVRNLERTNRIDPGNNVENLKALAEFSQTIAKVATDIGKRQSENEMWDEYSKTFEYGMPIDRIQQQEAGYQALSATDERLQVAADKAQANGAPPEAVMALRKVSGSRAVGRARAFVDMAGTHYGPWLEKQFSQDNQTQVELNGETFTPLEAGNDPVKRAAASSILWKKYLEANGMVGMKAELLAPAFRQMKQAEQQMLAETRLSYAIASSDQMLEDAKATAVPELRTNPGLGFNNLVQAFSRSLDQRGNPLGFKAAREKAIDFIRQGIDVNDISRETIDAIRNSPTPHQPNKTWGELYKYELAKLDEELDNNYLEDSRRQDAVMQQQGKSWTDQVLEEINANPPSKEQLDQLIKKSILDYGFVDDRLQHFANNYSKERIEGDRLNKEFEVLAQSNRLTLEMVTDPRVPWDVRQRWQGIAKQQTDARSQTGDFKAANEAIENAILAAAKYNSAQGSPKHYTISLATAAAKSRFNTIVSTLIKSGKATPEQAAQQALQQVITDIGDGTNGKFAYSQTDERGFVNFGFNGYGNSRQATADGAKHMDAVKAKVKGGGLASLDTFALIPKATLQAALQQGRLSDGTFNPSFQPPAIAQYISELYGGRVSAFEVLNRQLNAQKLDALPVPEPMQAVQQTMSPRLQQLLMYRPSPNRVNRAMVGSGQPPIYVRQGKDGGSDIIQLMSSIGFEQPALAAAQWALESGWGRYKSGRNNVFGIKGSGSTTTTQEFINGRMVSTSSSFRDYNSVVESAQDYAKLLRESPRYRQVLTARTPREAAIRVKAAGYATDPDYVNKLIRTMQDMGINPDAPFEPARPMWRQPSTMRPSVVYKIGNLGYGSTDDHMDVKRVDRGTMRSTGSVPLKPDELDNFVEVQVGKKWKPLSKGTVITDGEKEHRRRRRPSYGIDYAAPGGTPVRLKNGARVVGSFKGDQGTDHLVIELPDGRRFQFLHGTKA